MLIVLLLWWFNVYLPPKVVSDGAQITADQTVLSVRTAVYIGHNISTHTRSGLRSLRQVYETLNNCRQVVEIIKSIVVH